MRRSARRAQGPFLPGYSAVEGAPAVSYGLQRLDHAVGNVPELMPVLDYVARVFGEPGLARPPALGGTARHGTALAWGVMGRRGTVLAGLLRMLLRAGGATWTRQVELSSHPPTHRHGATYPWHAHPGFHEFAEFVAEDVGTVDSGLNSMVMANNNEMVLLPINEPTHGTKR